MRRPGPVLLLLGVAAAVGVPLATSFVAGSLLPAGAPGAGAAPSSVGPEAAALQPQGLALRGAPLGSAAAPGAAGAAGAAEASPPLARWLRGLLAAATVFAVAAVYTAAPRAAHAEGSGSVNLFFGQGCFWHVQHELIKKEISALGRDAKEVTALSGYAGGNEVGDKGRVCYHNLAMAPDYGRMGHTEVVNVSVPEGKVVDFAKEYFDAAVRYPLGRADPQDRGTEYRSAIGVPGGVDGPLFKELEAANGGRLELVRGQGNDADTVGTKKIWVYDSDKFPFHQGEVYHQFHDDMLERYSEGYHKLKGVMQKDGKLQKVECPEVGF